MEQTHCHKVNSTAPSSSQHACSCTLQAPCSALLEGAAGLHKWCWKPSSFLAPVHDQRCPSEVQGCGRRRAPCTTSSRTPLHGTRCHGGWDVGGLLLPPLLVQVPVATHAGASHVPASRSVDRHCEGQLPSSSHTQPISHFLSNFLYVRLILIFKWKQVFYSSL